MNLSFATRAAAVIALLAYSPVQAQEAGQRIDQAAVRVATASEPTFVPVVGVPMRAENTWTAPSGHDTSWTAYGMRVWSFVHTTTVQPAIDLARTSGEWIAMGSSAAAGAAQNAGQWLAANATTVVITAQDTGEWVVSSSSLALNTAVDTASKTFSALSSLDDWSVKLVREVENHLRADNTSEFTLLIKESGFVLANIKVEIGIIPELAVEFRHERDLNPEEGTAFKTKVQEYVKKSTGTIAYFEGLLLRRLANAGEYTGGMRISEIHVDVFPLPGMEVFFDPFRFEQQQTEMLAEAYELAEKEENTVKALKERLVKLEALVAGLKSGK